MKKAYYRMIPVLFDETTSEIKGRNKFYGILLDIMVWIDVNVMEIEEFPIWIKE